MSKRKASGVAGGWNKKRIIGTAAAGALGYIAGNIPGALAAGNLYQTMSKHGFTVGRRGRSATKRGYRSATSSGSPSLGASSIRGVSGSRSMSRSRSVGRVLGKRVRIGGIVADDYHAVARHSGKRTRNKKMKVAKLKPAMKRAIKKVMTPNDITGRYTKKVVSKLFYGGNGVYPIGSPTNIINKQKVEYLDVAHAFQPVHFFEAAGILWHNKNPGPDSEPVYEQATDFIKENFTMTVIKSWCKVKFRNNSERAFHMKFWIAAPKKVTNLEPLGDIEAQLQQHSESNVATASGQINAGSNVLSVTREKLGLDFKLIPGFNKNWACEVVDFLLQPGQTYEHTIAGPNMLELDYQKLLNGGTYIEQQKYSRYMFVSYYTDLIADSNGNVGYFPQVGATFAGKGVLVDQTFGYHLKMPEQVGFEYGATTAGTQQKLNKRRHAYAYADYINGQTGTAIRVDDEAGGGLLNP